MTSTPYLPPQQRADTTGAPGPIGDGPVPTLRQEPPTGAPRRAGTGAERLVLGTVLAAVGVGWLLDELGVSVPWALLPAAALILVGGVLVVAARAPGGHGTLVTLGAVLAVLAAVVAVTPPVSGPVGDRTIIPTAQQWPLSTSLSAGTLTLDLTRNALPATGTLTADVGAGKVVLLLPASGGPAVDVTAKIGMGQVQVDGRELRGGMGIDWSTGGTAPVTVQVEIGAGQLEVRHG